MKLPYGEFFVDGARSAVLIAGGTGITAFSAYVGSITPTQTRSIHIIYGARSRKLLLYRDLIDELLWKSDRIRSDYFIEQRLEDLQAENEHHGILSVREIWDRLENPNDSVFYLSGPPPMIDNVKKDLDEKRIPPARVRVDAWV